MASPAVAVALGFGLGLSLAVPPGAVNALITREATRGGAWAGVRAGLPAPIVDTAYMLLVLFGLTRLIDIEALTPWLAGIGSLVMLYLAWDTARVPSGDGKQLAGPWAVWAVTLTNPFQYAWWLTAGASALVATAPWGVLGFLAAIFSWVFVLSFLVAHGALRWAWFSPAVTLLAADLLFVYALRLAFDGLVT